MEAERLELFGLRRGLLDLDDVPWDGTAVVAAVLVKLEPELPLLLLSNCSNADLEPLLEAARDPICEGLCREVILKIM